MKKYYYWADNAGDYFSDNLVPETNKIIEIKRLNFFIGRNNSGKSRFLRELFLSNNEIGEDISNSFSEFKQFILQIKDNYIGRNKEDFFRSLDNFNSMIDRSFLYENKVDTIVENIIALLNFNEYDITDQEKSKTLSQINMFNKNRIKISKKYYIPILRGMRPFDEKSMFYNERTNKDYFNHSKKDFTITGENLYHELAKNLLGEPEQRKLVSDYQKVLSQYFFDNHEIALIPKYEQDVVYIKIGDEPQLPIYNLGDGLQQVIILTYQAFVNKEPHMFFIEEPELHMHAGMVRQLMNFYLNETKHYYFFTTHSNHLLDMVDETDQAIIQKFTKERELEHSEKYRFNIYRCDKDRELLASLGVRPSSVYLANCTIWVEGITDRLYLIKYMEKYLENLQEENPGQYEKYRRFMPNYHYAFVEYAGSNLAHWSFDDYSDNTEDRGLNALAITSQILLICDGDVENKSERLKLIKEELEDNVFVLECKEIENTLPFDAIIKVAQDIFSRKKEDSKEGFDIDRLNSIKNESYFDKKMKESVNY